MEKESTILFLLWKRESNKITGKVIFLQMTVKKMQKKVKFLNFLWLFFCL